MGRHLLFYMGSMFCILATSAQTVNTDSLVRVALAMPPAGNDPEPDKDSLFQQLSTQKSTDENLDIIYTIIDDGYDVPGEGLTYFYKILEWARLNNDRVTETAITAELGYNLYMNGNGPEGTQLCLDALMEAQSIGDNRLLGIVYDNLYVVYASKPILALDYIQKALRYSIAGGDSMYVNAEFNNLASLYRGFNKMDSSRYFAAKGLEWAVNRRKRSEISSSLYRLAQAATDERQQLYYLRAADVLTLHGRATSSISNIYTGLGKYYLDRQKMDSAFYYANKALSVSKQFSINRQLSAIELQMNLYKNGDKDSALKYMQLYYVTKDSVHNIAALERAQVLTLANQQQERELALEKVTYANRIRITIFTAVIISLLLLATVFWRNNKKMKLTNWLLQRQKEQVQTTLQDLKLTQAQLIQSEKMASLGELTAGIAHEIQNPLNFVNNFSEVSNELIAEMREELDKGNRDAALAIAEDLRQNLEKINHHGKRADGIVKGMLQHSHSGSGGKELTDINALCDEYIRLSYHGLRAKDKSFLAKFETTLDASLPRVSVVPQEIGRVVLNLINNAFYAVTERRKTGEPGYDPLVQISTRLENGHLEIQVRDNGTGIPQKVVDKIFQPFFTTKPTGQGTGLGLSLSYDIVKAHGGEIRVETNEGEGTVFTIQLPIS